MICIKMYDFYRLVKNTMDNRYKHLTEQQIKDIFKAHHYKCIPVDYINYIRITYNDNVVKRYNRAQISNKIEEMNKRYAKVFSLYDQHNVNEVQIELRFDKLSGDVNTKLGSWYDEVLDEVKNQK